MHKKILLVFDDYAEMLRTQTDLVKIGFDLVGIVNEARLTDQLLVFNPDLVLTAGRGGKVSAVSVAQKLKENSRFHGRVIVMLPATQRPSPEELSRIRMDGLLEFPCSVVKLIQTIGKALKLDTTHLIDKYRRARIAEGASDEELSTLRVPLDLATRRERALQGIEVDPKQTSFTRQDIKERMDDLKKGWDLKKLNQLDDLRKQFAKALFKKSR